MKNLLNICLSFIITVSCAQNSIEKIDYKSDLKFSSECLEFSFLVSYSNYFLHLSNENTVLNLDEKDQNECAETKTDKLKTELIIQQLNKYELLNEMYVFKDGYQEITTDKIVDTENLKLYIQISFGSPCHNDELFILLSDKKKATDLLIDIGQKLNYKNCFERLISEM